MNSFLDYRLNKTKKKLTKMYENGFWYINTYNALGSKWLIEALKELNLPMNYRLGSFAANSGLYEADAFKESDKEPVYYLSDIHGSNLKDEIAIAGDNFNYISGNVKAQDVTLKMIGNKPLDVIMDIKGALWYALNIKEGTYEDLVEILTTYNKLLSKNGYLLIDWYDFKDFKWKNVVFHFKNSLNKKRNLKYFGELSTKYYINALLANLSEEHLNNDIRKLNVDSKEVGKPLSEIMQVAVIDKKTLQSILNYARANKETLESQYEEYAKKQFGNKILKYIAFVLIIIVAILFGLIFIL